ncbi:MAG: hypothetical protein IPL61_00495 [Myxococcales bacterium]|nr:hypothetical protein [Myxococcales bacterium]
MRLIRFVQRPILALIVVGWGIALSSCSGGNSGLGLPECEDGRDNDGDLLIDELDPACIAGFDRESEDPIKLCADGLDNDGDGLIDTADPGCTDANDNDEYNAGPPACSDRVDNDGDGKTDFPFDPGCLNANQDSETDNCNDGDPSNYCPQCGDGADNDRDGSTDYPADSGCQNAADNDEFVLDTSACGVGTQIGFLPASGMAMGTAGSGISNLISPTCQGRGQETVYVVQVDHSVTMVASTDSAATNFNTVLYIRESCRDDATELACADDISATNTRSELTVDLTPGVYFLVVDARDLASSGNFALTVNFYSGPGEDCVGPMDCAPGYVCRAVAPSTQTTCEHPVCSDGRDDDADGHTDFPNDPGCTDADDGDETDTCPAGPGCPECGDGIDNDGDGDIDYPNDIGCRSANGATELDCSSEIDPLIVIDAPTYNGTTVGASNDQRPTCGSTTTFTAPDRVHFLDLRVPVQTLTVTITPSFDSAISFVDSTCTTSLACADPNTLTRTAVPPGAYGIVVDGWSSGSGTYSLNVRGDLTIGAACNDPLVAAGVLVCPDGYACTGAAGSETCQPAECNDMIDQDGDGFNGFPTDPGCASISDGDESDDCPAGPTCPACSNALDDDGDGITDYPLDPGCQSAGGVTEIDCSTETDPLILVTGPTYSGTTVGATNDLSTTCDSTTAAAPDRVHYLTLAVPVASLTVTTVAGFDAVTSFTDATCSAVQQCQDFNPITMANLSPGGYGIVMDGWSAGSGTYSLDIRGTLLPNGACNDPLVATGLLSCPVGYSCGGTPGMETCQPAACNDAIDQDGDGFVGYPTDPGCTSPSDSDETDDCPTGPMCPVCSNTLDDDSDGQADYPADFGCASAAGATEVACAIETDPVLPITGPATSGTTVGASNSLQPTCGSTGTTTAPERVHLLNLRVPVANLAVNLVSSFDAATSIRDATCGTTLQCSDPNVFARANMAPGAYSIVVDGWSSGSGTYTLNLRGDLLAGGACNDPLVAAGVLFCPSGYACGGAVGMETCQPAACNDAIDADGDGFPGYPTDPGCTSISDGDETDDCPSGPMCPQCGNGIDDDGDGQNDYPADNGCISASDANEVGCGAETDDVIIITAGATMGTTVGASNSLTPTCGSTSHTAPERVHLLTLPVPVTTLSVNLTSSFDAATSLLDNTCGATLQCSDPNAFTRTNVAAGTYAISVDGWSTGSGTYTLNVVGDVALSARCDPAMVTAGLLRCPAGAACAGAAGAEICVPAACNDAIDADGDGFPGYPTDPGCASTADNDETDDCPSGPMCPVCANGLDDDGDGQIDYPMDTGCSAASGTTELACATEADPITTVIGPLTTGTTVGAANNFTPTCQSSSLGDRVHILSLSVPVATLRVDTENSTLNDTVLMVMDATCGTVLACDDDGGLTPALSSLINLTSVAAGNYAIVVDTYGFSTEAAYNLNVHGTIASGSSCNDPLVAAGALTCAVGTTCQAGVCSP